jgi:flagellar export protein FliJ
MSFRFKFETLMNVRKIRENIAQQAFSEAQRNHLTLMNMKTQIEARRDDLRNDLMNRMKRGLGSVEVKTYYDYLSHMKTGLSRLDDNIRIAEQQVDVRRQKLLEAKREHKAMERLKEIHQARFDTVERKKEMNFIDELAISRHGGGR